MAHTVLEIAANVPTGLAIIELDMRKALSSLPQPENSHILQFLIHPRASSHPPRLVAGIVKSVCLSPQYSAFRHGGLWPRLWSFVCPVLRTHVLGASRSLTQRPRPSAQDDDRDVFVSLVAVILNSTFYGEDFEGDLRNKIVACDNFLPTLVRIILVLAEAQHPFVYIIWFFLSFRFDVSIRKEVQKQLTTASHEFDIPAICDALFKNISFTLQSPDSIPKLQLSTRFLIDCLESLLSKPDYSSPKFLEALANHSRLVSTIAPYLIACATSFDAQFIVGWNRPDIEITISAFYVISECLLLSTRFGYGVVTIWLDEGLLTHLVSRWRSGVHRHWPELSSSVDNWITELITSTGCLLSYRSITHRVVKQMADIRAAGVLDRAGSSDRVVSELLKMEGQAKAISRKRFQFDRVCGAFPCSSAKCSSRVKYMEELTRRNEDLKKYGLIADVNPDPLEVFSLGRPKRREKWRWCSRCRNAVYCTQACQRAHWKTEHKAECFHLAPNGRQDARPGPSNLDIHFIRYLVKRDILVHAEIFSSATLGSKKPLMLHYDVGHWPLEHTTMELTAAAQTQLRQQLSCSDGNLVVKITLPSESRVIFAKENLRPVFSAAGSLSRVTVLVDSPSPPPNGGSSNPSFSKPRHDLSESSPDSHPSDRGSHPLRPGSSSTSYVPSAVLRTSERGSDSPATPSSIGKALPGLRGKFKKSGI